MLTPKNTGNNDMVRHVCPQLLILLGSVLPVNIATSFITLNPVITAFIGILESNVLTLAFSISTFNIWKPPFEDIETEFSRYRYKSLSL